MHTTETTLNETTLKKFSLNDHVVVTGLLGGMGVVVAATFESNSRYDVEMDDGSGTVFNLMASKMSLASDQDVVREAERIKKSKEDICGLCHGNHYVPIERTVYTRCSCCGGDR